MKIIQTIREGIQSLLQNAQLNEQSNRRRSAYAYTPSAQERFRLAAEENAREAAELSETLDRR